MNLVSHTYVVASLMGVVVAPYTAYAHPAKPLASRVTMVNDKYIIKEMPSSNYSIIIPATSLKRHQFSPKSKLGKAMWEARQRILASGEPLMETDALLSELEELRRGW